MASVAQIEANRANALHSTGPNTPAGIESSKLNATRHGLTGKQVVIKGENPAQYDALRASLIVDYAPANECEAILVEDIAQNYWRLQRARRIEAQVIDKFGQLECILDPEAAKAFRNITRYLNSIERSWRNSTCELDKLQRARREEQETAAKNEVIRAMANQMAAGHQSRETGFGFVSQRPAATPAAASPGKLAS